MTGIYLSHFYTSTETWFYIGASIDIKQRWYGHLNRLRRGKHANKKAQSLFDGGAAVYMEPLQLCDLLEEKEFPIETVRGFSRMSGISARSIRGLAVSGKEHPSGLRVRRTP